MILSNLSLGYFYLIYHIGHHSIIMIEIKTYLKDHPPQRRFDTGDAEAKLAFDKANELGGVMLWF